MKLFSGMVFGMVIASVAWLAGGLGLPQADADLGSAYRAFNTGDLDTAIDRARQIWNSNPENIEALTLLVRALIYRSYTDYNTTGDLTVALNLAQEAAQWGEPGTVSLHAFALQASGQTAEALRLAEQVLARLPENTLAQLVQAQAFNRFGAHDRALSQFTTITDDAWQLETRRAMAITLGNMGRYDEALAAVESAIQMNERLVMLHFERALYAIQKGDADAATVAYFRVLAFDPDNVKARLRMCELSTTLRETANALRYCGEVIQRAPDWSEGWYRIGREYYLQGEFVQAQRHLNQCTTVLVRQNVPVEDRRFECWYLQGQAAEILGDCESLTVIYSEFQAMSALRDIPQTWTYPPEGPPICQ